MSAGAPYIGLSADMQAYYARRGMWADGAPRGMLATWLGEPVPWRVPFGRVAHWTTHEGLQAMRDDAIAAPPQAWSTYQQRPQFLRRLREASERAGAPSGAHVLATAKMAITPASAPFAELSAPPAGTRARAAFELHVMRTLREFVVFTQGSAYTE